MPPIFKGSSALQEQVNSPDWTFGEEISCVRSYRGQYAVCLAAAPGRGVFGSGIVAGLRVLESRVTRERGALGLLVIRYGPIPGQVYGSQPLPPTEEELQRNQLDFAIASHQMFVALDARTWSNINTLVTAATDDPRYDGAFEELATLPIDQKILAENAYRKLNRGITVYQQYPPIFKRTSYYWDDPSPLSGGGFLQTPIPQIITIPTGFNWLRQADELSHNGTNYVLREAWLGAQDVEADLYAP